MADVQWVPVIAALLGGGAMGAIIAALVTHYRNRRQPVGYKKEIIEIFRKHPQYNSLRALLALGGTPPAVGSGSGSGFQPGSQGVLVDNFSIVRYTLINKGNQDIGEYEFGVTLEGSNKAVDVKVEAPDRHHKMIVVTPVSLNDQRNEIDFILQPFNRKDSYSVNIYFSYNDSAGPIELSSPHATNFVDLGSPKDLTAILRHESILLLVFIIVLLLTLLLSGIVRSVLRAP